MRVQEPLALTKRQKQVLDFIASHQQREGYAPSLDEIAKKIKFSSSSTAHFHVQSLQKAGYLVKTGHKARGISVYSPVELAQASISTPLPVKKAKAAKLPLNKIILGDAVAQLQKLPDASADIIILDPPYNIGKDFGNNKDRRELVEYVQWSKSWMNESVRVLKPAGTMYIYGFSEILAHLSVELPLNKRWLIWHYTNKNVASLHFWQRSHESIICAWKDKPAFNRDSVREPYTEGFLSGAAGKTRASTVGRFSSGGKETTYNAHVGGALPRDVIKVAALAGGAGMVERWFLCKTCGEAYAPLELKNHAGHNILKHPTQKPLELTRKLIKAAAPGRKGLVLVPFVGTGSELAAAKELGHDYLGYELNPDYIKIAEKFVAGVNFSPKLL